MVVMKIKCAKYANVEMNGIKTRYVLLMTALFCSLKQYLLLEIKGNFITQLQNI